MSTAPLAATRAVSRRVVPSSRGPSTRLPAVLVGVAVGLGVLARLHTESALWLDESLSVGIARLPVPDLLRALRQDGSPPLYYLLLHGWIALFGASDSAVRSLSTVLSLGTLPVVWFAGRRLGGDVAARSALLLLAVSPFAVRYGTETRMYALLQLLSAVGLLLVLRSLERPSPGRLGAVALSAGALALTHYWALFLLAVAAGVLLRLAVGPVPQEGGGQGLVGQGLVGQGLVGQGLVGQGLVGQGGGGQRAARRSLAALLAGGVLFVPWLPTFVFQVTRTGTPWATPPRLVDSWYAVTGWAGGGSGAAIVLSLLLTGLAVLAVLGHPQPGGVTLGRPWHGRALLLLAASVGTLLLGLAVGMLAHAGFSSRYSSVALVPGMLLAGLGVKVLPERGRTAVLALAAVCGLVGSLPQLTADRRTQAALTAQVLRAGLAPGDVVAYCPDQLGPSVSRLLPAGTAQVVYPSFAAPGLVDWVDYAQRNALASPSAFARELAGRTGAALWLVSARGYRTLGTSCELVADQLRALRGEPAVLQQQASAYDEQQAVRRYPPAAGAGAGGVAP